MGEAGFVGVLWLGCCVGLLLVMGVLQALPVQDGGDLLEQEADDLCLQLNAAESDGGGFCHVAALEPWGLGDESWQTRLAAGAGVGAVFAAAQDHGSSNTWMEYATYEAYEALKQGGPEHEKKWLPYLRSNESSRKNTFQSAMEEYRGEVAEVEIERADAEKHGTEFDERYADLVSSDLANSEWLEYRYYHTLVELAEFRQKVWRRHGSVQEWQQLLDQYEQIFVGKPGPEYERDVLLPALKKYVTRAVLLRADHQHAVSEGMEYVLAKEAFEGLLAVATDSESGLEVRVTEVNAETRRLLALLRQYESYKAKPSPLSHLTFEEFIHRHVTAWPQLSSSKLQHLLLLTQAVMLRQKYWQHLNAWLNKDSYSLYKWRQLVNDAGPSAVALSEEFHQKWKQEVTVDDGDFVVDGEKALAGLEELFIDFPSEFDGSEDQYLYGHNASTTSPAERDEGSE